MKKIIGLLSIILCFGFTADKDSFDITKKQKENKPFNTYGATITKLEEGKWCGINNLMFEPVAYLKTKAAKEASDQMWDSTKISNSNKALNNMGGYLTFYVTRNTILSANTKFWTVIIQDEAGKELLRKQMEDDIPNYHTVQTLTYWYNYGLVALPANIPSTFYVYLVDAAIGGDCTKTKFKVTT